MKKILLLLLIFFIQLPSFAIEWTKLTNSNGRVVYLDKDSIKEFQDHYFYNIMTNDDNDKFIIITIQSAKSAPFSARIKTYSKEEYNKLKGDYENITLNLTENLEALTFESTVNTCCKEVKRVLQTDKNYRITF